jgi:hypothetical protein
MVTTDRSDPDFDPRAPGALPGRRQRFVMTLLGVGPSQSHEYPDVKFRAENALYVASPTLVYTVVPWEEPNELGFSEIAWTGLGNVRLWGALAFSIVEGKGFYSFYPIDARQLFFGTLEDEPRLHGIANRLAARHRPQSDLLHGVTPKEGEIRALYAALNQTDYVLLRGVSCYLKSHLFWGHPLFMEEMGINLYISLEAGLSVIRKRLSLQAGRTVSFAGVFDFVSKTFSHGDALADYWQDAHDDRNALLHPANEFSPHVIQPMSADDIYELFEPMLSLYRYILLGGLPPI